VVTEEMSGGQHRTMKRKRAELQKRVEADEQRLANLRVLRRKWRRVPQKIKNPFE
jgi:hypothetical protein